MFASRLLGRSAAWLRSGPSRLGATSRPGVAALCAATAAASFTSLAATQYASLEEAPTTPEENQAKEKERLAELARSFAKLDGKPVEVGKTRVLHSKILDEDRLIVISTPTGYDDDEEMAKEKFDVLYVIDPEDHQLTAVGTTHHLAMSEKVPPLVVVGIFNVDRNRDLLPVAKHGNVLLDGQIWEECNSGGAKQFLSFIKEELVPWIESEYRVTQRRTLFGHSFGGLFNLYSLCHEPDLFSAHVANDPSVWWDLGEQVPELEAFLKRFLADCDFGRPKEGEAGKDDKGKNGQKEEKADTSKQIAFFQSAAGDGGKPFALNLAVAAAFEGALSRGRHVDESKNCSAGNRLGEWGSADGHPLLRWKFVPMLEERHHSSNLRTLSEGLQWVYKAYDKGWSPESEVRLPPTSS